MGFTLLSSRECRPHLASSIVITTIPKSQDVTHRDSVLVARPGARDRGTAIQRVRPAFLSAQQCHSGFAWPLTFWGTLGRGENHPDLCCSEQL